jgi:hypothetical protein
MTPMSYASAPEYGSLASTSGNVIDPILTTTSAFNSPMITSSQPYTSVESAWHQAIYDPLPEQGHSGSWNASWIPNADFVPQIHTPPPSDVGTAPHPQYPYYEHMTPSPQSTPQMQPADVYVVGPYDYAKRPVGSHQGLSSVSELFLQPSSLVTLGGTNRAASQ